MTNDHGTQPVASFKETLVVHHRAVTVILVLALAFRIFLALWFPLFGGDEIRYTVPAVNMLDGHGFTSATEEPYSPSVHTVPLYPIFIAAVFALAGRHNLAIRLAQDLFDLGTCLFVAFISFSLAPFSLKKPAAISGLAIYGFLSWFTVHWTRYILTETLALFFTCAVIVLTILALKKGWRFWFLAGIACGLALMTRADSVLLVAALLLFVLLRAVKKRTASEIIHGVILSAGICLAVAPWVVRNYVDFQEFQPLASEYGFARYAYMPDGYLRWLRTWLTDETYFDSFKPVFAPHSRLFDPRALPESVFDSTQERTQIQQLFDQYNQTGEFTEEMNNEFRAIANQRIRRAPFRFFVWLPLKRVSSVWLTSFATHNKLYRALRILFILPILIGGITGFVFLAARGSILQLLVLVILTRTIFLGYHYAPEARYIVEAYPAMIAACGVTMAWLWSRRFILPGFKPS